MRRFFIKETKAQQIAHRAVNENKDPVAEIAAQQRREHMQKTEQKPADQRGGAKAAPLAQRRKDGPAEDGFLDDRREQTGDQNDLQRRLGQLLDDGILILAA